MPKVINKLVLSGGVLRTTDGQVIYQESDMNPTNQYSIADLDTGGATQYFGYIDKDGKWYIMQLTGTQARYFAGTVDYAANWANRAALAYQHFNLIF